jgi:hypothetical protein
MLKSNNMIPPASRQSSDVEKESKKVIWRKADHRPKSKSLALYQEHEMMSEEHLSGELS